MSSPLRESPEPHLYHLFINYLYHPQIYNIINYVTTLSKVKGGGGGGEY